MNHPPSDVFLASCGSSEPLRVAVRQRAGPIAQTWTFQQPFLVIGRRPESDLVLDHWQVSRRHTYLQLIEGRYYCVDLGSRTGTHGGDATERSGWLEPGRAIQIGPFAIRPEWPDPAEKAVGSLPGVTWELPGRAIGLAAWRMDRHLALIGRSPACKIRIVEPDVSKFHCSVVLTVHGAWVVDLLGQNGVFVNDRQVRSARVEDGDTLRVGRHTLRARYDSPPAPLPRPAPATALASATQASPIAASPPPAPLPPAPTPGRGLPALPRPPMFPQVGRELVEMARWSVEAAEVARRSVDPGEIARVPVDGVATPVNLLMHQFGLMQQQMFDQFHQTMMMMFEGFAAIHREQSDALREELDRVRGLSREIEELRAETARLAEATARAAGRPRPATGGYPKLASPALGGPVEPARRAVMPAPEPGADIHAQLCLKLATIESERQNRWQKILGMMASRS